MQRPSLAASQGLHRRGVGGGLRFSPVSNSALVSTDPASVGPRLEATPEPHSPRQVSTDPESVEPRLEAINPHKSPLVSCLSAPLQIESRSLDPRGEQVVRIQIEMPPVVGESVQLDELHHFFRRGHPHFIIPSGGIRQHGVSRSTRRSLPPRADITPWLRFVSKTPPNEFGIVAVMSLFSSR